MRGLVLVLALLAGSGAGLWAQQPAPTPAPAAPKDENPFPGETPQTPPATPKAAQSTASKPADSPAKPEGDNAFPGEDPNVPVLPFGTNPDSNSGSTPGGDAGNVAGKDAGRTPRRDADPNGDPVRSPDPVGNFVPDDDGFSSSRSGLKQMPAEDDSVESPGKSGKSKTREQVIQEDVDVGSYYLDRKNWRAAQSRFAAAFALDSENPDAVWGLAEAEQHLGLNQEALEHYRLFLTYDPDSKKGKEARRAVEELQAANPKKPAESH